MERTFIPERAVGFFQVANLSAAITFSAAYATAKAADARLPALGSGQWIVIFGVEGANVRWRNDTDNTVAVTAAVGNRIIQDTELIYTGNDLATLQFIEEAATAKLNVQIFKHSV